MALGGDGLARSIEVGLLAAVALHEDLAALNHDDRIGLGEFFVAEHLVDDSFEFLLMWRRTSWPRGRRPWDAVGLGSKAWSDSWQFDGDFP